MSKDKTQIKKLLKTLGITSGIVRTDGDFYILDLQDSNEYSKFYTLLDEKAQNTEYPSFETDTAHNTTKIINYFEYVLDEIFYNFFLIADFANDKYYLKIREQPE